MNKGWGPAQDDDWQDCEADGQPHQQQPVKPPPGNLPPGTGPLPGYASSNSANLQWKSPPEMPPLNINSMQAGKGSNKGWSYGYGYGYQTAPYDPNDDPWVEGKEQNASMKPVLEIFG